jgi:hypothetical protein
VRIPIDQHTRERARERGVSIEQIQDVLHTGVPELARGGRLSKHKVYDYHGTWKGRFYEQQMVQVIYLVEDDVLVTVTVVVHHGRWKDAR